MNKAMPVGIGVAAVIIIAMTLGLVVDEPDQSPSVSQQALVSQENLRNLIDEWMDTPEDDDTNQRLEIMSAYYTFEESGQKLTQDREGLLIMNQIRKMVSLDMPVGELDQLRQDIRDELRASGFETECSIQCLVYDPVCGEDGVTYGCGIEDAACNEIKVKHVGECKDSSESMIMYVDSELVDCVGVGPQQCLLIRESPDSDWWMFYDQIDGFDYQEGTQYKLEVMITDVENPPADSSSIKYVLKKILESSPAGIFDETLQYTLQPITVSEEKGYAVTEIADGVYWLVGSGYQTMFLVTGQGVVAFDAPKPIGEKYLDAISEVTSEPITHMIYSHHHQDHTGAAGQIFSQEITYVSHKDASELLKSDNDPNRPVPTMILEGDFSTLEIGDKMMEFHDLGAFHSKGNMLILLPDYDVAMLVDLFRPAESPYRGFGVTPDIDLYVDAHDALQNYDFEVLISGHTNLLATKKHVETNKMFTLDVMQNAKDALYLEESNTVETCSTTTIEQWTGKLGNLEGFIADHCNAMIEYLQN